jgi:hypothetical protein
MKVYTQQKPNKEKDKRKQKKKKECVFLSMLHTKANWWVCCVVG